MEVRSQWHRGNETPAAAKGGSHLAGLQGAAGYFAPLECIGGGRIVKTPHPEVTDRTGEWILDDDG